MATKAAPVPGNGIENQPPEGVFRPNLNDRLICPDCKQDPANLVEDGAELVCTDCGIVLKDRMISYESEWRTFNSDDSRGEDPNRVGEADNDLLNGSNLGTQIGGGFGASGASRKLQLAQSKLAGNKSDVKLQEAYARLDAWGEALKIQAAPRTMAKSYYKKAVDSPAFRGKNTDGVLAGCLFIACRQLKVPRSFAEMMGMTSVPKKELGRMYKQLEKFLQKDAADLVEKRGKEGLNPGEEGFQSTTTMRPQDVIERFCNQMGIKERRTINIATELAKKVTDVEDLAGRSPLSTAAACIFMACHLVGIPKSYKQISLYVSVSDATIKQAYKKLYEVRNMVVDVNWVKMDGSSVKPEELPSS